MGDTPEKLRKNFIFVISEMQKTNTRLLEMNVLHKVWNIPLDGPGFKKIILFFNKEQQISPEYLTLFDQSLFVLKDSSVDPFIKCFYMQYVASYILVKIEAKNQERILRILILRLAKDENILEKPVLYHLHLLDYAQHNFCEQELLQFIEGFHTIFRLGTLVLQHAASFYEVLTSKVSHMEIVKKIEKKPELFPAVFAKPVIGIADVMETMEWKRDKAARFLNGLVDMGYLSVEKVGRENSYVNETLLKILSEIRKDQVIKSLLN